MHKSDLPANSSCPLFYLIFNGCPLCIALSPFLLSVAFTSLRERTALAFTADTRSTHTHTEGSCTWTLNWILHVPETGVCWTLFWQRSDSGNTEAWTPGTGTERGFVFIPACVPPISSSLSHSLCYTVVQTLSLLHTLYFICNNTVSQETRSWVEF